MIREEDIPKTNFQTRYGYYKFLVIYFGLTNVIVAFISLMYRLFKPFLGLFLIFFIDAIQVYSTSKKDNESHFCTVLGFNKEKWLYAKYLKYEF